MSPRVQARTPAVCQQSSSPATCRSSPTQQRAVGPRNGQRLDAVRLQGRHAAESGVPVGRGVDLYLSAARRVWAELPAVIRQRDSKAVRAAAEALLQVVDEAVASFADGHAEAGRELIRKEEALRRDLVDDLLRGDAHLSELVGRAEPFGLDLTRAHQVALAQPGQRLPSIAAATSALERVVLDRFGDRDVLVATKEGLVVVIALAEATGAPDTSMGLATTGSLGKTVHSELSRLRRGSPWRVAIGRAHPGAYGIARSYEEAREGLTMAARMHLDSPIVETRDLLTYRVLARDQPALTDLVYSVLHPLRQARGGAGPTAGDPGRLLRLRLRGYRSRCPAPPFGTHGHLPPRPRQVPHRLRPTRPSTSIHPAHSRPGREAARLARAAHPRLRCQVVTAASLARSPSSECGAEHSNACSGRWRATLPTTGRGRQPNIAGQGHGRAGRRGAD